MLSQQAVSVKGNTAFLLFCSFFRTLKNQANSLNRNINQMQNSFLARSKENLDAAEVLLNTEHFNASANRAYYAAFHAAIAALFHFGYTPEIDHKPVQASFNGFLVRQRKIFPSEIKSDLLEMLDVRGEADYRLGIGRKKAAAQFKQAKQFTSTVFKVIE